MSYITGEEMRALPVGTRFYVHNGAWHGQIVEDDGEKRVLVEETGDVHPMRDNPEIEITIEDEQGRPQEAGEFEIEDDGIAF